MGFTRIHPPANPDKQYSNQTELSHVTVEELQQLRKLPVYTRNQKILQVIYFIIIGIPKLITVICYSIIAFSSFLLGCFIWRLIGRPEEFRNKLKSYYAAIARIFLFILGYHKINYHGEINPDARFLVCNHVTFFDGWFFLAFAPRPLAKKELFSWPVIGDMLEVFDGIAVDRSKNSGVSKKLIDNALDSDAPPAMLAPEGATTSGLYMFKFHLGAFLSDLPVQPIAIRYTIMGMPEEISHLSFLHHNLWHTLIWLGIPTIKTDVYFFDPMSIKTDGQNQPAIFAEQVELKIANFLGVKAIDMTNSAIFKEKKVVDPQ